MGYNGANLAYVEKGEQMYTVKRVHYERIEPSPADLITIKQAADALGLTIPGVVAALNRGRFTEIINEDAPNPQRERRLLLRSEVEARLAAQVAG